jgi:hypothetical protein
MIEAYDPVWLADAAMYWNNAADHLYDTFSQVHAQAQGLGWQGASGDALTAHTQGMHTTATGVANQMRGAATIAREGVSNLTALASRARYAIEDAQADGFAVGHDLSVTDTRSSRNPVEQAARQAQAKTHAGDIVRTATALWTHNAAVAGDMTNATAGIDAVDNACGSSQYSERAVHYSLALARSWPRDGCCVMVGGGSVNKPQRSHRRAACAPDTLASERID